jgi:hypothetical protein
MHTTKSFAPAGTGLTQTTVEKPSGIAILQFTSQAITCAYGLFAVTVTVFLSALSVQVATSAANTGQAASKIEGGTWRELLLASSWSKMTRCADISCCAKK